MFDKLFDKLEKMDDKLDATHTKIETVSTSMVALNDRLTKLEKQDKDHTKDLKECHKRHDRIEGGLVVISFLGLGTYLSKAFGWV